MTYSTDRLLTTSAEIITARRSREVHIATSENCIARNVVSDVRGRAARQQILAVSLCIVFRPPATARESRRHEYRSQQHQPEMRASPEHHWILRAGGTMGTRLFVELSRT